MRWKLCRMAALTVMILSLVTAAIANTIPAITSNDAMATLGQANDATAQVNGDAIGPPGVGTRSLQNFDVQRAAISALNSGVRRATTKSANIDVAARHDLRRTLVTETNVATATHHDLRLETTSQPLPWW